MNAPHPTAPIYLASPQDALTMDTVALVAGNGASPQDAAAVELALLAGVILSPANLKSNSTTSTIEQKANTTTISTMEQKSNSTTSTIQQTAKHATPTDVPRTTQRVVLTTFVQVDNSKENEKEEEHEAEKTLGNVTIPLLEFQLRQTGIHLPTTDLSIDKARLHDHLILRGFAPAPNSQALVTLLNDIPAPQLHQMNVQFAHCCGVAALHHQSPHPPTIEAVNPRNPKNHVAALVQSSIEQLRLVLDKGMLVVGPLEGTFRGKYGGISWLHDDEHRTSVQHFKTALFPSSRTITKMFLTMLSANREKKGGFKESTGNGRDVTIDRLVTKECREFVYANYEEMKKRLKQIGLPFLDLPNTPPQACLKKDALRQLDGGDDSDDELLLSTFLSSLDLLSFTKEIVCAIRKYNNHSCTAIENQIVLDVMNVWVPKKSKRLAILPFEHRDTKNTTAAKKDDDGFEGFVPGDTRPSKIEITNFVNSFESFSEGIALFFHARHVLHQVLEGPSRTDQGSDGEEGVEENVGIVKCDCGSVETRYMLLGLRKCTHRFVMRRKSCVT